MKAIFESILFSWQQCHTGAKVKNDCAPKYCISGKSNVSGGNVEMGARGRYIGRRAILSQLPHQREREREGGDSSCHTVILNPASIRPTKLSKPNQTKPNLQNWPNQIIITQLERGGAHSNSNSSSPTKLNQSRTIEWQQCHDMTSLKTIFSFIHIGAGFASIQHLTYQISFLGPNCKLRL